MSTDFRRPGQHFDQPLATLPAATFTPPSRGGGVPVGMVMHFAGGSVASAALSAEDVWLPVDGGEPLKADYPELFAVLGTVWGVSADPTRFVLPPLRGRFVIGPNSAGPTLLVATTGGVHEHTLTVNEIPAHRHTGTVTTAGGGTTGPTDAVPPHNSTPAAGQPWQSSVVGGGLAHNNMPPYVVLAPFIRARS